MTSNALLATLNAIVLAATLMAVTHAGLVKLKLPTFDLMALSAPLAVCPFLVPPDCVEPLPGL